MHDKIRKWVLEENLLNWSGFESTNFISGPPERMRTIPYHGHVFRIEGEGALCVQMDFTWTFQTNTKCNNINHV